MCIIKPAASEGNWQLIPLGNPRKQDPIHALELIHLKGKRLGHSYFHSCLLWTVPGDMLIPWPTKATSLCKEEEKSLR